MWWYCDLLPTCPFNEELVSPTTDGLLTDHLQMSAPDRDYLSCREPLNPRSRLSPGGPHPRFDPQCSSVNAWPSRPNSEQLRTTLALTLPLGPAKVRLASQLNSLCPVLLPYIPFHRWQSQSLSLTHTVHSKLHLRVSFWGKLIYSHR